MQASVGQGRNGPNDELLPITKFVGACIPPFLVVAFIILFFLPNDTDRFFAWTIRPAMTPLMMGAGYISGSYYFIRMVMGGKWHWFGLGLLPIAVFTWFMGLATFLHWDKFNHHHVSFFAWLALYVITPVIVPLVWLNNRSQDPKTFDATDAVVPQTVRLITGAVGVTIIAIALFMFLFPKTVIDIWPWALTPLTCRVVAGWFALPGAVGLSFASDQRWSAWRITLQSQVLGIVLIMIGVVRGWNDFDTSRPMTWLFVAGMVSLLAYLVGLYVAMESTTAKGRLTLNEGLVPPT
jgi:hypothetical protein